MGVPPKLDPGITGKTLDDGFKDLSEWCRGWTPKTLLGCLERFLNIHFRETGSYSIQRMVYWEIFTDYNVTVDGSYLSLPFEVFALFGSEKKTSFSDFREIFLAMALTCTQLKLSDRIEIAFKVFGQVMTEQTVMSFLSCFLNIMNKLEELANLKPKKFPENVLFDLVDEMFGGRTFIRCKTISSQFLVDYLMESRDFRTYISAVVNRDEYEVTRKYTLLRKENELDGTESVLDRRATQILERVDKKRRQSQRNNNGSFIFSKDSNVRGSFSQSDASSHKSYSQKKVLKSRSHAGENFKEKQKRLDEAGKSVAKTGKRRSISCVRRQSYLPQEQQDADLIPPKSLRLYADLLFAMDYEEIVEFRAKWIEYTTSKGQTGLTRIDFPDFIRRVASSPLITDDGILKGVHAAIDKNKHGVIGIEEFLAGICQLCTAELPKKVKFLFNYIHSRKTRSKEKMNKNDERRFSVRSGSAVQKEPADGKHGSVLISYSERRQSQAEKRNSRQEQFPVLGIGNENPHENGDSGDDKVKSENLSVHVRDLIGMIKEKSDLKADCARFMEILMKKMDRDGNGIIDRDEFLIAVNEIPEIIETFSESFHPGIDASYNINLVSKHLRIEDILDAWTVEKDRTKLLTVNRSEFEQMLRRLVPESILDRHDEVVDNLFREFSNDMKTSNLRSLFCAILCTLKENPDFRISQGLEAAFYFEMIDTDSSNSIDHVELFDMLYRSQTSIEDCGWNAIDTLRHMSREMNGEMSYHNFKDAMKRHSSIREAFGCVLNASKYIDFYESDCSDCESDGNSTNVSNAELEDIMSVHSFNDSEDEKIVNFSTTYRTTYVYKNTPTFEANKNTASAKSLPTLKRNTPRRLSPIRSKGNLEPVSSF